MRKIATALAALLAAPPASARIPASVSALESGLGGGAPVFAPATFEPRNPSEVYGEPVQPQTESLRPAPPLIHREYDPAMVQRMEPEQFVACASRAPIRGRDGQPLRDRRGRVRTRCSRQVSRDNPGVTRGSRVANNQIQYIVLHAAQGTYRGTISEMERSRGKATHFVVSARGEVTQMVDTDNIANDIRNDAIQRQSVGIETESGSIIRAAPFLREDWDPDFVGTTTLGTTRRGTVRVERVNWRFYMALARLIRAVCAEASVPTNRANIITHHEADAPLNDAESHIDPGPYFDPQDAGLIARISRDPNLRSRYLPVAPYRFFETRFPGQNVTPREFLMRLVNDGQAPTVEIAWSGTGRTLRIQDPQNLGLLRVTLISQATRATVASWEASNSAGYPSSQYVIPMPLAPGVYTVEAEDIVGNVQPVTLTVEQDGGERITALEPGSSQG